ncbi:MAG: di-heme-cytochrome C peroxidase [Thermoanaerobaculia bacterium]
MRTTFGVLWCLLALSTAGASPQFLDQNWSEDDRQWFYTTPQGSKLIPYAWALALERDDQTLWVTNLDRFGFLPNRTSVVNPDGLPVGIVRDDQHVGITCAACHTNQVDFRGTTYQIDGAPTNASLWDFLKDLGDSLDATAKSASSARFRRFATRVLGANDTPARRAKLYAEVKKFNDYFSTLVAASKPNTTWGRARTDAFGMIFNRVTSIDLKIPSNSRRPDAPVSYPFLWDTSWHNKVQWNGSAPNSFAVERLARNVGEVLGVFAEIDIRKPTLLHPFYKSTAKRLNLLEIEDRLSDLRAPKWQPAFGAIDDAKRTRGQLIYDQQCLSCHAIATPGRRQSIVMTPLSVAGTDPQMATVAATRQAKTGVLKGVREFILFGSKMGDTAGAGTITLNAVIGAILSPVSLQASNTEAPQEEAAPLGEAEADHQDPDRARLRSQLLAGPLEEGDAQAESPQASMREELEISLKALGARKKATDETEVAYKARPLDGIWATAPFLHNGSVPTLWDLLLPAAQRPATFHVGSRELDPLKVGFDSSAGANTFLFDTTAKGNSNAGHEWGTSLTDADRASLIEYLKSL